MNKFVINWSVICGKIITKKFTKDSPINSPMKKTAECKGNSPLTCVYQNSQHSQVETSPLEQVTKLPKTRIWCTNSTKYKTNVCFLSPSFGLLWHIQYDNMSV